jgi:hypothetical protein
VKARRKKGENRQQIQQMYTSIKKAAVGEYQSAQTDSSFFKSRRADKITCRQTVLWVVESALESLFVDSEGPLEK